MIIRLHKLILGILVFGAFSTVQAAVHIWNVTNSAELLAAVASLKANVDNFWGGTIILAPGTYTISASIVFNGQNHVNIVGSGPDTIIKQTGGVDALVFINSGFSTVRDLWIKGDVTTSAGSGIVFKGSSSSCCVNQCVVTEFAASGIRFQGSDTAGLSSNTVSRCRLWNNRTDQLYSYSNHDFYFFENQIGADASVPRTGVVLDHSSAGTYSENKHAYNMVALRLGPGSHYNRIEHNDFAYSRQNGILIGNSTISETCQFNIILGNTIHTSSLFNSGQYTTVEAYYAQQTTFTCNSIFSADTRNALAKKLLDLNEGCSTWIVTNNVFQHSRNYPAVSYSETAGHVVSDNTILPLAGDLNVDGKVDFGDLVIFMNSWLAVRTD